MSEEKLKEEGRLLNVRTQIPEPAMGEVGRTELLAWLEQSREEVVVLQAAAGYGKTTVMAELARMHEDCCWYRLEESDNDPEYFLRGMCYSISEAMCLPAWEKEEDGQNMADMRKLYRHILSAFLLPHDYEIFYMFLDDFQVISDERIYRLVEELIEYGKGKIRFFLTVKGVFPKFLAVYLMQGRLLIASREQFDFDSRETRLLLKRVIGTEPPKELVQSIQEYTGGWPAGIIFAAIGVKNGQLDNDMSLLLKKSHLYDYIFYEIFRKLPNEIQIFLVETSVLEEMDEKVCDYALERSDSGQMLEYAVVENLFISRISGQQNRYCYSPFFLGFLRSRVLPERKKDILSREEAFFAQKKEKERENGKKRILRVKCLGAFWVEGLQGALIWRTRKTKELFACLFFEAGRGLSKDVLLERLWPETDREKATVIFHTTISYLRRALAGAGAKDVLVVENQTYAVNIALIDSDIKTLMEWTRFAGEEKIPEDRNVMEVAELYRECYMYGEDYIWIGEYREYVERIFLQTIGSLARMQMKEMEYEKAARLLQKAAVVDCYEISLSELLVECLILSGDIKGAKRQYEKMCRVWQEELYQTPELDFRDYVKRARERHRKREC